MKFDPPLVAGAARPRQAREGISLDAAQLFPLDELPAPDEDGVLVNVQGRHYSCHGGIWHEVGGAIVDPGFILSNLDVEFTWDTESNLTQKRYYRRHGPHRTLELTADYTWNPDGSLNSKVLTREPDHRRLTSLYTWDADGMLASIRRVVS